MNQTELISAVAEQAGLSKADAGKVLEALIDVVTETLKQGDEVRISNFGTFATSERGERPGRNPQTGEAITIAASKGAKFTPAKAIKTALNGD
jgi:DNA-binding protein HU-beta